MGAAITVSDVSLIMVIVALAISDRPALDVLVVDVLLAVGQRLSFARMRLPSGLAPSL